ncbi:MAG: hypothetical protein KZQ83_19590, partial [gamma proteobacterium symbiont of Taylorina sp.]|nr:hypothetical protein [gamma proteobacterium symbiont of Taylorina sp.]
MKIHHLYLIVDNNKAYISDYAVYYWVQLQNPRNVGDSFFWRWTSPDGGIENRNARSRIEENGNSCWMMDIFNTFCYPSYWHYAPGVYPDQMGEWKVELLVEGELIPETMRFFEVIGRTLETVNGSSYRGRTGTTMRDPIQVKLVNYDGTGKSGKNVTFTISSSPGGSRGYGLTRTYNPVP